MVGSSRGCVRLVGYVLYETLRWMKSDGTPNQQDIAVPLSEIVAKAKISRGAISKVKQEAIAGNFLEVVQKGIAKGRGTSGTVEIVRLHWCDGDSDSFAGFYSGRGRRTLTPHAFFTHVIPHESLSVIRVVATVIRQTIGYENQFGGRRTEQALSYAQLVLMTGMSRKHVRQAVKVAIEKNYIRATRLDRGATVYSIKWQDQGLNGPISSKWNPVVETEVSVHKGTPDGFKKEPANSSKKSQDAFRKEPPYKEEKQCSNKQQSDFAAENFNAYTALIEIGFDESTASKLATEHSPAKIQCQIKWLKVRHADRNVLGLLRKAIEENWQHPRAVLPVKNIAATPRPLKNCGKKRGNSRQNRAGQRQSLLIQWNQLSTAQQSKIRESAIEQAQSNSTKQRLAKFSLTETPPNELLKTMAVFQGSQ